MSVYYKICCNFTGVDTVIGISDITDNSNIWRSLVGEFLGTLMLVLIGCGSVIAIGTSGPSFVQIGLTFGLVVATMAQVSFDKHVLYAIFVSLCHEILLVPLLFRCCCF